jgi:hypothetical protein
MMGALQALVQTYDRRLGWTLALPHLGVRGATRHSTQRKSLPDPLIEEFSARTKDRNVLCVEVLENGKLEIVPLLAPCGFSNGHRLAKRLILSGVHPFDIVIASESEGNWTFKNSIDWMFWTHEDQKKLDAEEDDDT